VTAVNHFIKKGVRQARIDEFLAKELQRAGYGGVEITKTPLGERITIFASRPGIVIGRRGKNIRMITDILSNEYGLDNPQIEVKEVVNPELNPKVMAYTLVSAIERGVHRRRAAYSVLRRVLNAGAKGCEIIISGKLTSKRSRHEAYRMGFLAKSGDVGSRYVSTANATAIMKLGTIGVTVSIMRGDIDLPDEITIRSIKLEEPAVEEVPAEEEAKEKVEPTKAAVEAAAKEEPKVSKEVPAKVEAEPKVKAEAKEAKKAPKEKEAAPAKKTDLDLKVEELSDLIEKTPGEEKKKAKKKEPAPKEAKPEKAPAKEKATKKAPAKTVEEKPKKVTNKDTKASSAKPKKEEAKEKKKTEPKKATEPKVKEKKTTEKTSKKSTTKDKAPAEKAEKKSGTSSKKAKKASEEAEPKEKAKASKAKKEGKAKKASEEKKKKEK